MSGPLPARAGPRSAPAENADSAGPLPEPGPERVVVFHDFSQALGGASHLVQVLIRELRAQGLPVTFIAGDDGARFSRSDVEFVPLGGKPLLERAKLDALTRGFHFARAHSVIRAWIVRNDTPRTIYHLHGWSKILTPAIFSALAGVRDRLVLHGHDYFNCCPNGGFFNFRTGAQCSLRPLSGACLASQCDKSSWAQKAWRSAREVSRRLQGGGVANAARLLMIHPGQRPAFIRGGWPNEKLVAVRNPVAPLLAERVAAENNRGAIFIGRISAEKGADLAAAAARQAGMPITFVGEGAEMAQVRAINPEAVMLGRLDREGVARALSGARVALMPSRWAEPFGLVALEAIGAGVPVIVSAHSLVAPEIAQAGFGLALDTNDIRAFAGALARLGGDDAALARMSHAGHQGFAQLCTNEAQWARMIVAQYREVLNPSRP